MTRLNFVTDANGHPGNNLVRTLFTNGEKVRSSVCNTKNTIPFEGLDTRYQVATVFKHWYRVNKSRAYRRSRRKQ